MKLPTIYKLCIMNCALCIMISSCSKDLDLKYHDIEPLTVIEAELTPEGFRAAITLTTPMDEPMNLTRLTDATVTLYDLNSGEEYSISPNDEGYCTNDIPGIVCHEHRLKVEREQIVY